MTLNEHTSGPSDDLRERVRDTTINDITLLSTDYCNHLNEVVMLIGMIGPVSDATDMLAEAREWKPLTYAEHFEASGLSIGPLAIEAYDLCEARYRDAFDTTMKKFDLRVISGCSELADVIDSGDAEYIAFSANALSMELQAVIDQLGGIIHGAGTTGAVDDADGLSQDDIDALF